MGKTIQEIEKKIAILEETLRIAEEIKNSGLILKKSGRGFAISRDYDKCGNLKRLAR